MTDNSLRPLTAKTGVRLPLGAPILTHQIATKSQQVLELYGQGLGASAIADQLGISRASTYRIIGEMGSGEAK